MKTILASFLAVAFLAASPVFAAADNPAGSDKAEKGDKKKDEGAKSGGGGW